MDNDKMTKAWANLVVARDNVKHSYEKHGEADYLLKLVLDEINEALDIINEQCFDGKVTVGVEKR